MRKLLWFICFLFVWGLPSSLLAEQYDVPILIESRRDIDDLYQNGDITEEERDRLLILLESPVKVNRATRKELYELPGLTYRMVDGILDARKAKGEFDSFEDIEDLEVLPNNVVEQIRPFVSVSSSKAMQLPPVSGKLRLGAVDSLSDDVSTASFLRTELQVADWVELGWVATLKEQPGVLSFVADPNNGDPNPYFLADKPTTTFDGLVKLYAATDQHLVKSTRLRAIVGSYVVGFGERLTFDTSSKVNPEGWYADKQIYYSGEGRVTPRRGLFGGAITLEKLELSRNVSVDWTVFASHQRLRLYQYDFNLIVDDDKDPFQSAKVYFSLKDSEEGADGCYSGNRCHAYQTFEEVFEETIVGGNQTLRVGERAQIGVTGFFARNRFVVGDEQVVFSPSARYPQERKEISAVGVDAAYGAGAFDLMAEWAVVNSGGHAVTGRALTDLDKYELELSGRYYQSEYDNPYTRARAQRDEFFGLTARDEAGAKARIVAKIFREWTVKSHVDAWKRLVADTWNLEYVLRSDWDVIKGVRWSSWMKLNDKDIRRSGRTEDYGESFDYNYDYVSNSIYVTDFSNLVVEDAGAGMKLDWGNRIAVKLIPRTLTSAYFKMSWVDENATADYPEYNTQFARRYVAAWDARVIALDWLRLKTRFRFEDQYMLTDARGDKLWEWYFQTIFKFEKTASISARYDIRNYIDDNPPEENPEHLIRVIADFRF